MGVNNKGDDGSGDSWNRNPKPDGKDDVYGSNYLGLGLIVVFVVLVGIAMNYT